MNFPACQLSSNTSDLRAEPHELDAILCGHCDTRCVLRADTIQHFPRTVGQAAYPQW